MIAHPAGTQLAIDGRALLPVLELQRLEAMAYPFIDVGKDSGRLGDPEIGRPSGQVYAQVLAHGRYAPADKAMGFFDDAFGESIDEFTVLAAERLAAA